VAFTAPSRLGPSFQVWRLTTPPVARSRLLTAASSLTKASMKIFTPSPSSWSVTSFMEISLSASESIVCWASSRSSSRLALAVP
jgi:hypothetical protein